MWLEFFKFDLRLQLRQPLLWMIAIVFALLAFAAISTDAITLGGGIGNINRNAPKVIVNFFSMLSVMSMFFVTLFIANAVLRDTEVGISDMLFATPMKKIDYLLGRFLAGFLACMLIFVFVALALLIGPYMSWVDPARVGAFTITPFIYGIMVFVIPNLLFIGALLMLLAATTRSMLMVYVGVICFFILLSVSGSFTSNLENEWISSLLDPFGMRAFGKMTRYYTTAEINQILPPVEGFLLLNRIIWTGISIALLALTVVLFKPQRAGTGRRWFGKTKLLSKQSESVLKKIELPRVQPQYNQASLWVQLMAQVRFDAKAVFKSLPFLIILCFSIFSFFGSASQAETMYGTHVLPISANMAATLANSFSFMLVIITIFYAGELIFKERQAKMADVTDAMPTPDWLPLCAKAITMLAIVFCFLGIGVLAAIGFQLFKGGAPLELSVYLKAMLLSSFSFICFGLFGLVIQVITNNKFLAYLIMILLMISQAILGSWDLNDNLYHFAATSSTPYSDMNGYGHFLKGWTWFVMYWSFFLVAALFIAQAFWVRGLSQEWKVRARLGMQKLRGKAGTMVSLCLIAFISTGGWIFYNTNVLNHYQGADQAMDDKAEYEKKFKQYKNLPHPRLTQVVANVDIYPEQRKVIIKGHYVLQNKTDQALDTLRIQINPDVKTVWNTLPSHQVTLKDEKFGFSILKLDHPLAAGTTLDMEFTVTVEHAGFTNDGAANSINYNGSFFNNYDFMPQFAYSDGAELRDRHERKIRGLPEAERMAKLEDQAARAYHALGSEADWIQFETTMSTSLDQTAMAPGYLQSSWEENGRRYFHYKMDRPMMPFFAFLSAKWQVKKELWKGIPIEVYYDQKHTYNLDRMIASTKKSLDYYTSQFTPYQHKQVRILEFPRYESFAQSFANTIPYSESMGFIADLRNEDDIDYVFYVTAHEIAHQWWGHQVIGANVQGSAVLMESLSQYFALMVMEKEYGRDKMRRFLKYELDAYLRGRGTELLEEQPLGRVENQQYIHYNKGSLIFYRLRDEIGEVPLNRALKRFLEDKAYQQAPYTTTTELLDYIRAETPKEKHAMLVDMFEKIVFYDNRVTQAKATQRADGQWDVTMELHVAKIQVDGKGNETPRQYDEPIELAIFSRPEGGKEKDEKVLLIEKRMINIQKPMLTLKFTVKDKPFEVGVDPYNKLIDRVSSDNRKAVSFN